SSRTEPGVTIRLWHAGQTAALPAFTPPQILSSDLSGFMLDLAHWGVADPAALRLVDQPPAAALEEARALLRLLGALDEAGALTSAGKRIRELALPPRLAAMILRAARDDEQAVAARLAVLLTEQGLGGPALDIEERLRRFASERG